APNPPASRATSTQRGTRGRWPRAVVAFISLPPSDRADVASRRSPSFERSLPCHPRSLPRLQRAPPFGRDGHAGALPAPPPDGQPLIQAMTTTQTVRVLQEVGVDLGPERTLTCS